MPPRGTTRQPPDRQLLTYAEAGHVLSISERTVRAYADEGHLTRVRFPHGRTTRVTAASVAALIAASTEMPDPLAAAN